MVELTAASVDPCGPTKLGLCIVAFVDGSSDASAAELREKQLAVLDAVRTSPANKVLFRFCVLVVVMVYASLFCYVAEWRASFVRLKWP
jgi:hypothetical protein